MKHSEFYLHWLSFFLGLIFGILGIVITLFAVTDRRDKIYSSILGCAVGAALSLLIWKYIR
ncbi:MAG TPA: hypothetical protein VFZ78_10230 [Flavisolibacter sp.]